MSPRKRLPLFLGLIPSLIALFVPTAAQAGFGINSFEVTALNRNGSVDLQAGSHPHEWNLAFRLNQDSVGNPEGEIRDLTVDLPPGLVGNPLAVPRCSAVDFEGGTPQCPGNTQVGIAHIELGGFDTATSPIYNLTPPFGVPARVGFSLLEFNGFIEASLRTGGDYGISVSDITVPQVGIAAVTSTIWGVPADPSHDGERFCPDGTGAQIEGCSSEATPKPFFTLPTSCTGPMTTTLTLNSVEEPDVFVHANAVSEDEDGTPAGLNNCEAPPFAPTVSAQPETNASDSSSGLHVNVHIPQNDDPEGLATAHLRNTSVTFPSGIAVNPSAAGGKSACTSAEVDLHGPGPANCPVSSRIGNVEVHTPLLDHPVPGSIYLAKQGDNPFNSLLAVYIAVHDPISGVVVKLAGKVEPDPVTGQLRTVFLDNPQLPFEDFDVDLSGGPRAALTTPPTCGTYTTTAQLTPWTAPEGATASRSDSFQVSSAPGGGPCAPTETQMPNAPSFEAGTVDPLAGAYSPFVLKLTRENGSQRISALNTTLPAGVTAKFAGVAKCSEAQIAQAASRSNPGQGAQERQSPSCPPGSQIGTVNVGAGSGSPLFVGGNVYLAGPYKGAPFSLAIITPAVAGPFDLGVVVVRAALYVNEETGQGTVRSDPLPTILQGIPLDVRSIAVKIDRSAYVLNPTSCEVKAVTAEAISTTGQVAHLSNRFQVGGCGGLGYSPKLSLSLKGGTKRSDHPALRSVLTQPSGQANGKRIVVILPPTEFIDPLRTANPCTRPQFTEGKCPPASVLGKAKVITPLFDEPLQGPVYFRANGGARELPDAVADLNGPVHFVLVGFLDAVHKKGSESSRVRTIFANVPDAPVTKAIVELRGGKKGTLVNSANLCKVPNVATIKMSAQNNKANDFDKRIATSCSSK